MLNALWRGLPAKRAANFASNGSNGALRVNEPKINCMIYRKNIVRMLQQGLFLRVFRIVEIIDRKLERRLVEGRENLPK